MLASLATAAGTKALPFSAKTLSGQVYSFDPQTLGKPHLMVFWATWCRECRYEFHALKALHLQRSLELNIVGISIDQDINKAIKMEQAAQLPYLNIYDQGAGLAKLFGVKGTPTLILIGRDGVIEVKTHRLNEDLLDGIARLIAAR